MNGRTIFRVLLTLVLVAAIAATGFYVYNIGLAQGRMEGAQLSGQGPGAAPYPPYWYGPYFRPFGFGFGFIGLFFLVFLIFFLARVLFWRPYWGRGRHFGGWDREVPPRLEEWHRKMHEGTSEER